LFLLPGPGPEHDPQNNDQKDGRYGEFKDFKQGVHVHYFLILELLKIKVNYHENPIFKL
jgi:hypothetical protein